MFVVLPTIVSFIFHNLNAPWFFSDSLAATFLFPLFKDSDQSLSLKVSTLIIKCFNLLYMTGNQVGGFSVNTISKVRLDFLPFPLEVRIHKLM